MRMIDEAEEEFGSSFTAKLDSIPVPPLSAELLEAFRSRSHQLPRARLQFRQLAGRTSLVVIAVVLALVVGVTLREFRERIVAGQAPTPSQVLASPTASKSSPRTGNALGHQLGAVTLGDSEAQVLAKLGQPSRTTITRGIGSPRWEYDSGYVIDFVGSTQTVWQIQVRAPAIAATQEGFTLRDTEGAFRAAYSAFQLHDFMVDGELQLQISTSTEVLIAGFGPDRRSDFILLRTEPGPP
jgi:hypothetical protein